MKFRIDENLPVELVSLFEKGGYEADSVLSESIGGCADEDLFNICQTESRVIVTLDLDFADIRRYPPERSSGIVVCASSTLVFRGD